MIAEIVLCDFAIEQLQARPLATAIKQLIPGNSINFVHAFIRDLVIPALLIPFHPRGSGNVMCLSDPSMADPCCCDVSRILIVTRSVLEGIASELRS
jgi:hypothetical protein